MKTAMTVEGLSPLEAYRRDLAAGAPAGAASLAAAMTLWEASKSSVGVRDLLRLAASQAKEHLGAEVLKRGCTYDARPSRSAIGILRLAAQETELAGYLLVTGVMLESLAAICAKESVPAVLVLAERSRNAVKRGRLDLAKARAEDAVARAKRLGDPDLLARGYMALGTVAQARGNYPELAKHSREALTLAQRVGNRRLLSAAHSGLGIRAAMARQFDVAVRHFSTAYDLARPNELQFFEAVGNLAQLALDTGHGDDALRIARHGLSQPVPLQYAFGLLGTAVLASASEGNLECAIWAAGEIQRLSIGDRHPRASALALTECWEAHTRLRRLRTASQARKAAFRLATTYGLPEILHRLDQKLPDAPQPAPQDSLRSAGVAALSAVGDDTKEPINVAITH